MSNEFVFERRNFLGIPPDYAELQKARFVVLPVPYERGQNIKRGTMYGPVSAIEASREIELFDEELWSETWKAGVHTMAAVPILDRQAEFFTSVANAAEPVLRMNKLLFTLGGEHSITEGPLAAAQRVHRKITVLQFDAHADLRSQYRGSHHHPSCAATRMLQFAEKLVQVGVRSVAEDERNAVNSKKVHTFLMHQNRDVAALIPKVLDQLTDPVYLSIDLSGFDPSVVPGVGAPEPGGFSWYDALDLFRAVINNKKVVAVDVVELVPLRESPLSEYVTARLVYRLMGYALRKEQAAAPKGPSHKSTRRMKVEKR
jgi:agmatinase